MSAPLAPLVEFVVDDDALIAVAGRRSGIVAIPEPARAIALAALADTSDRRPIVVAVPTSADAERLAHDLAIFVGEEHVEGAVPVQVEQSVQARAESLAGQGDALERAVRCAQAHRDALGVVLSGLGLDQVLRPVLVEIGESNDVAAGVHRTRQLHRSRPERGEMQAVLQPHKQLLPRSRKHVRDQDRRVEKG